MGGPPNASVNNDTISDTTNVESSADMYIYVSPLTVFASKAGFHSARTIPSRKSIPEWVLYEFVAPG
jgi:hypothetical protein